MKTKGLNSRYDYVSCDTWHIIKISCMYAIFNLFRQKTQEKPHIKDILSVIVIQYGWKFVKPVQDIKRKAQGAFRRLNRLFG